MVWLTGIAPAASWSRTTRSTPELQPDTLVGQTGIAPAISPSRRARLAARLSVVVHCPLLSSTGICRRPRAWPRPPGRLHYSQSRRTDRNRTGGLTLPKGAPCCSTPVRDRLADRNRTCGPLVPDQVLSLLSYSQSRTTGRNRTFTTAFVALRPVLETVASRVRSDHRRGGGN